MVNAAKSISKASSSFVGCSARHARSSNRYRLTGGTDETTHSALLTGERRLDPPCERSRAGHPIRLFDVNGPIANVHLLEADHAGSRTVAAGFLAWHRPGQPCLL